MVTKRGKPSVRAIADTIVLDDLIFIYSVITLSLVWKANQHLDIWDFLRVNHRG
jgi:hypothetical protein